MFPRLRQPSDNSRLYRGLDFFVCFTFIHIFIFSRLRLRLLAEFECNACIPSCFEESCRQGRPRHAGGAGLEAETVAAAWGVPRQNGSGCGV